ncbi:50S ribosomal protein L18 [Candidatus Daviesbacteria bacterium]|nr:50S ribosomal protein L18 [Candidatus Daviesbacteria bacterium]
MKKATPKKIRHLAQRKKIKGTNARPRLAVFRSNKHISAQIIDDVAGRTLVFVSDREIKSDGKAKIDLAYQAGKLIAQKAKAVGLSRVVLDRAGNKYHGRIRAFAQAAREEGLIF